tara:strand:+ start:1029 stop:1868 length:840 start_codon:yes stop_codon:yes gene_type:complete
MRRKKVDNSLFRYKGTAIPKWIASKWELEKYFPDVNGSLGKTDKNSETEIQFNNKTYTGHLTCSFPKNRANKVHRLWLSEELTDELKREFVMSNMRDIESALRGDVGDIEKEIPFWEFVDIEFDPSNKRFIFISHYKHEPLFPELFKNLAGSPALKIIEYDISQKHDFRIHKQDWKPKEKLDTEIGALNAIYTLIDKKNKLIYVGEAKDLRKRLKQKYPTIPNWTHYRYDALPRQISDKVRLSIERMVIRSYASLLKNKSDVDSVGISSFCLTNDKIDK